MRSLLIVSAILFAAPCNLGCSGCHGKSRAEAVQVAPARSCLLVEPSAPVENACTAEQARAGVQVTNGCAETLDLPGLTLAGGSPRTYYRGDDCPVEGSDIVCSGTLGSAALSIRWTEVSG